jgi:AraC family transcriptional regulator of adaptative response / DNA-3-methyladenine glycosylase II
MVVVALEMPRSENGESGPEYGARMGFMKFSRGRSPADNRQVSWSGAQGVCGLMQSARNFAAYMQLDRETCYKAMLTHDSRFDGVFFICVRTTGIYCRPVCTVKPPLLKNINFVQTAAAAEAQGYRPCLRCRPELAPGKAIVDAINRSAEIVANMIEDGVLNQMTVAQLAADLGMSERHLRRVVETSFGVSPLELAQTQRLLMAKRLLADTNLPITEVAFASGFSSLRRFNALLKERYGFTPSKLRSSKRALQIEENITCQLSYRPPFDWSSLLEFLRVRSAAGIELVDGDRYCRTVSIGKERGWIVVTNDPKKNALSVQVSFGLSRVLMPLLNRLRKLFDLNANPQLISSHLGELAALNPGLRVPGAFDGFETAVRGILGQQVSVKAATTLMTRFVNAFGDPIETNIDGLSWLFPSAEKVAKLSIDEIAANGIISSRAKTILALASAVQSGAVSLQQAIDPETRIAQLKALPGFGDWTSHYIAMRVLSWPDAFPHADLGIRKALNMDNDRMVLKHAESWRPWRSYAAMHLWKSLEAK